MAPRINLAIRLQNAFRLHGYDKVTMGDLAIASEVTRRTLYNHFDNKEDAFRFTVRSLSERSVVDGISAGHAAFAAGASIAEILVAIYDIRFGNPRRWLEESPHAVELNAQAQLRCRDILTAVGQEFAARLGELFDQLHAAGRLPLREPHSTADVAQAITDAVRGANTAMPPSPPEKLLGRYRQIVDIMLFGALDAG